MREDLAAVNVTRTYTLAASNIAIFTFMLFFLYPRFETGRINLVLFQAMLIVRGPVLSKDSDAARLPIVH